MARRTQRIQNVQRTLMRWFQKHQRDLPWRRTKHPYKILVSEIMLQQTQVDRVIPKYRAFLRQFPTVHTLAEATPRDVLLAWEGMGYNRRALYLLRAAQEIVARHRGKVPGDPVVLQTLPGVGAYTAAAVATFSSGVPHVLADVNVRRVVGRVMLGVSKQPWNESRLWRAIEQTTPRQNVLGMEPVWWGHAVMDFGALVCKAKPRCDVCPLQKQCKAYPQLQRQNIQNRPRRANRGSRGSPRFASTNSGRGESGRGNQSGSHPNVPDRIYRGRILQILREEDPHPVSVAKLRTRLPDLPHRHFHRLLRGLSTDGLLVVSRKQEARLPHEIIPPQRRVGS